VTELDPRALEAAARALSELHIEASLEKGSGWRVAAHRGARAAVEAYLDAATAAGFRIIEPGHIPMPQTKEEAGAMILLGESYLAAANERDAAPPAAAQEKK
jgi:hypothetical protein